MAYQWPVCLLGRIVRPCVVRVTVWPMASLKACIGTKMFT
jgi:hypothetical protein